MVHAACRAHARRQFFEAVQLNPQDPVATPIVARMDELFALDAEARRKGLTVAARHVRRQETAKDLLDDIRGKVEVARSFALPSSVLSKACQYVLTLWKKLTRFLECPELELVRIWRRIRCVPWLSVGRIGCTSAVHSLDQRLRLFSRSWKAAAG